MIKAGGEILGCNTDVTPDVQSGLAEGSRERRRLRLLFSGGLDTPDALVAWTARNKAFLLFPI